MILLLPLAVLLMVVLNNLEDTPLEGIFRLSLVFMSIAYIIIQITEQIGLTHII